MEQETKAHSSSRNRAPAARGSVPSKFPSMILKFKWPRCRGGSAYPVGNILGMGAKVTTPPPLTQCLPPSLRTRSNDSFYGTSELPELAKVKDPDEPESPGAERSPITANEYAVIETKNVESPTKQRTYMPIVANVVRDTLSRFFSHPGTFITMQGFTTGLRGAAANYNAMPGGFNTEQRNATYAELFDYIVQGDIMDRPVEI
ncbi:hypothetical protein FRC10_003277 [Ceratobasidium sp. 414]|nr:hypothetical protein FRC10_003277 [Ceratobasidium sp. 414]